MNEINHAALLNLGFSELAAFPQRYVYKGVTGRFEPHNGTFHFHGYSRPIDSLMDLKYFQLIIEHHSEPVMPAFPNQLN